MNMRGEKGDIGLKGDRDKSSPPGCVEIRVYEDISLVPTNTVSINKHVRIEVITNGVNDVIKLDAGGYKHELLA